MKVKVFNAQGLSPFGRQSEFVKIPAKKLAAARKLPCGGFLQIHKDLRLYRQGTGLAVVVELAYEGRFYHSYLL